MSLVAALLVGSSAFAIDNVKVSGDAKLYYSTEDSGQNDLFNKNGAAGQAALGLGLTADLVENVSAGAHLTALSTLGLQGQLVGNVWEATNGLTDTFWFDEAWIAASLGKTTAKIGRMELDTPLVFTEKWSIAKNTFEAAVLLNQDIPDTTIVAAYVGGSNGQLLQTAAVGTTPAGPTRNGYAGVVQDMSGTDASNFTQFYGGAFAIAVINNSWKPLTAQAWYFNAAADAYVDATDLTKRLTGTDAYWLQADFNMEGIMLGAQYAGETFNTNFAGDITSNVFAVMAGYDMKDVVTAKVSYSQTDKDHAVGMNLAGSGQSKLYTEAWWNYGYITKADTSAYNVTIESPVNGIVDLGLYYTSASVDSETNKDMSEITVSASKSFGPLDASLVYILTDAEDKNNGDSFNTIQAYLTLNF